MAEIKSTMDIIMEKTKSLTMSEEEKAEYRHKELNGKVRGLVQKYLDGVLDLNRFRVETAALSGKEEDGVKGLIIAAAIPHIQLGDNNAPIFRVLKETAGEDIGTIQEMEKSVMDRLEEERADWEKRLRERLEKNGVSGSAVIPNLKADPDWKQFLADKNEALRRKISKHLIKNKDQID